MDTPRVPAELRAIVGSITPACERSVSAVGDALARRDPAEIGDLEALARRLSGARHSTTPDVSRKHLVVCAADHGVSHPGAALGERSPTIAAVRQIARGQAAVNAVARSTQTSVLVIDCGIAGGGGLHPAVIDMRLGDGTADVRRGPAMSLEQAAMSLQTGVALMLSVADAGADCVALGQVAPGGYPAVAALIVALTGGSVADVEPAYRASVEAALAAAGQPSRADPLAALAALGGYEVAVLTGVILAAASIRVPIVLDEHGTAAAAVVASYLSPASTGYLIASHIGNTAAQRRALHQLDLEPLFDLGLAHGEGTGACLALPMIDSAARLLQGR